MATPQKVVSDIVKSNHATKLQNYYITALQAAVVTHLSRSDLIDNFNDNHETIRCNLF